MRPKVLYANSRANNVKQTLKPKATRTRTMKRIYLVFTRDFDQCLHELIRQLLLDDCKKLWGASISDQIIHFTGRSSQWLRYEEDMQALKKYFVKKSMDDPLFSEETQEKFIRSVHELRAFLDIDPATVKDRPAHLHELLRLFRVMYPIYPPALFVPGPWRQEFVAAHGKTADAVLKRLEHSRHESEGVVKETGSYLRRWLEPLLEKKGYPRQYVRLLTLAEVQIFVQESTLPAVSELDIRAKGFVHYQGTLIPTTDFNAFLCGQGLFVSEEKPSESIFRGTVASPGPVLRGRVQIIMNSYDADAFNAGSILVTPMTSPEYLPAMKTAKAIVTDEGGLTCHAAIVSRELGVPCVIGTKSATAVLKDGDEIELNATTGTIRKLL